MLYKFYRKLGLLLSLICFDLWLNTSIAYSGYSEEFSGVYSFGDSFTSEPKGWSGLITNRYGFSFTDNKTNFAFGSGKTTDLAFILANYRTSVGAFDPNALYLVFMGPSDYASSHNGDANDRHIGFGFEAYNYENTGLSFNDFKMQYNSGSFSFAGLFPITFADIQNRANLYGNFIKQVSDSGGQYIVVLNQFIDDLRQQGLNDWDLFFSNIWSNEFNKAVQQQIEAQVPNANIIFVDTKRLLSEVTNNPAAYFTAEQIQGTQYDQGFFIDAHPTIFAHKLLAEYISSVIESPSRIATLRELPISFGQNIASDVRNLAISRGVEQPDTGKLRMRVTGAAEKEFSSTFTNKQLGFREGNNFSGGVAMDLEVAENLLIGGGIKYFESETHFAKALGKARVSEPNYSLHGIYNFNKSLFGYFAAAYGSDRYSINRTIPLGIAGISHKAKTNGTHSMESFGVGYSYSPANMVLALTPFMGMTHQKVTMKPYSESGNLRSTSMSFKIPARESIVGELGMRIDGKAFEIKQMNLIPSLTAIFTHEFNDPIKKRASGLVSDMPKSFLVPTYSRESDFILSAELVASIRKSLNISLSGSYKPAGRFNERSIGASLKFNM
jgi:hypothetical protein